MCFSSCSVQEKTSRVEVCNLRRERDDFHGKGREGQGREGRRRAGKGRGRTRKGREEKGREGEGREGKRREGQGREGEGQGEHDPDADPGISRRRSCRREAGLRSVLITSIRRTLFI